jgi:hypothetical protein
MKILKVSILRLLHCLGHTNIESDLNAGCRGGYIPDKGVRVRVGALVLPRRRLHKIGVGILT